MCTRQRKVDATVVEGVLQELLKTPLAGPTALVPRVNTQLGRNDLTTANIQSALEQISCMPVLQTLRRQLEAGKVPYQEAYLLAEMTESLANPAAPDARWGLPSADRGMRVADPTVITALVTPELPLAQIAGSLCWVIVIMTLFYWNVPLSVLGRWCGVHKTTILRWVLGLALALWPLLSQWIIDRVNAPMVYVDEKWLKIRGRWHYWDCRLGCGDRAASGDGFTAVAKPMGLSLAWSATAPVQESPARHHHRWVTGLCTCGAGSPTRLVSFPSPARRDPVAQAAFHD
ncbi:MAG TPA: hypothetical protein VLK82_05395 [Candidatus Tectomicrobia bacterium]|nr:hypothetical protein [Candidatus Tectomicrobia bacterium]